MIVDGKKFCSNCNNWIEIEKFNNDKTRIDGLYSYCKQCCCAKKQAFQIKHKQRLNEISKQYYVEHKSELNIKNKIYREEHKEEIKIQRHGYYEEHIDEIKNYQIEYYATLTDEEKEQNRQRDKEQRKKPEVRAHRNASRKIRKQTDPNYKIMCLLRGIVHRAITKQYGVKAYKTQELIGCTVAFLMEHLQATAIKNGYLDFDINNFSSQEYHIDHIIPCSAFNLQCGYHQRLCFNWQNVQILTAKENILKSNIMPESYIR